MKAETENAIEKFKLSKNCKIPMLVGALDGTHITIVAPDNENKVDYYNGKQRYNINTQVAVGGDLIFLSVATGYPGSLHNSRVLRNSNLFQRAENDAILAVPTDVTENIEISPLLIADSAYDSKKWLISPYNDANLHVEERRLNRELSKCRSSVERAFGLLVS